VILLLSRRCIIQMQLKSNLNSYIYNSIYYIIKASYHVSKQRPARAASILNKKAKQMIIIFDDNCCVLRALYTITIFYDLLQEKQIIIVEYSETTSK